MNAVTTATALTCSGCSQPFEPGDRFCPSCGTPTAPPPPAATSTPPASAPAALAAPGSLSDQVAPLLASHPERIASGFLLESKLPFCRACGADHEPGAHPCPACGCDTAPLPPGLGGTLGSIYALRRGLRKRRVSSMTKSTPPHENWR